MIYCLSSNFSYFFESVYNIILPIKDSSKLPSTRGSKCWRGSNAHLECGHRGCGNSFNTRNKEREIHPEFMANIRENSLQSFLSARQEGNADMVEFDVTLSKDEIPIIYHDLSLLYDGETKPICTLNSSELKGSSAKKLF